MSPIRAAGAALVLVAIVSACTNPSPSTSPTPPATEVAIAFDQVPMRVTAPAGWGEGELEDGAADCGDQVYAWDEIPTSADDPGPHLFLGTAQPGCPEAPAQNGRFPSWWAADELPDDATPVELAVGDGHRFAVVYTQCTNECYERGYDFLFIETAGSTFWIGSFGIEDAVIDAMAESVSFD